MRAENSLLLLFWFHYSVGGFDKKWSNDYIIVLYFIHSQKNHLSSLSLSFLLSISLFLCWQSNLDPHTCYDQMSWSMRSGKEKYTSGFCFQVVCVCVCVCLSVCGQMCIFVRLCLCLSVCMSILVFLNIILFSILTFLIHSLQSVDACLP